MKSLAIAAALVLTVLVATGGATACGQDVCEKANDISEECAPPTSGTVTPRETTKSECSGTTEASAKCIVDNKDAFCAYIKNASTPDPGNAYVKCAAAVQ